LENSRPQADLRARLHEVRESRVRLITTTDAERRRTERNLHDGAHDRARDRELVAGVRRRARLLRGRDERASPPTRRAYIAFITLLGLLGAAVACGFVPVRAASSGADAWSCWLGRVERRC
jgi:hypothetical protein